MTVNLSAQLNLNWVQAKNGAREQHSGTFLTSSASLRGLSGTNAFSK